MTISQFLLAIAGPLGLVVTGMTVAYLATRSRRERRQARN